MNRAYLVMQLVLLSAVQASAIAADRVSEICKNPGDTRQTLNAAAVAAELGSLTGFARHRALGCLRPRVADRLTGDELARVVGNGTAYRHRMLCTIKDRARVGLRADEVAAALGALVAFERHQALECLEPQIKFADGLTASDLVQIVGDGTGYRERMLCTVREHNRDSLSARDAAAVLDPLVGFSRYLALQCLEPSLASRLTEEDVNIIVGNDLSHRGRMMATLGAKTLDGMNAVVLQQYKARFPSQQFLGEGDPPNWLEGQCIAWARRLYSQVSERSVNNVAFGSARNIPTVLRNRGFTVVEDPARPRVGSMVVWDEGGAGHVGVIASVSRDAQTGTVTRITVSEANYGRVTAAGGKKWGLTEEQAKREFVTERYGTFAEQTFPVTSLDRGVFKFVAYVYP